MSLYMPKTRKHLQKVTHLIFQVSFSHTSPCCSHRDICIALNQWSFCNSDLWRSIYTCAMRWGTRNIAHTSITATALHYELQSSCCFDFFFYRPLFTVIFRRTTFIMCFWLLREKEEGWKSKNWCHPNWKTREGRKQGKKRETELNVFSVTSITSLIIIDRLLIYWLRRGRTRVDWRGKTMINTEVLQFQRKGEEGSDHIMLTHS